jgi:hypothetical protein
MLFVELDYYYTCVLPYFLGLLAADFSAYQNFLIY